MKLTKQKLKEIIKEEMEAFDPLTAPLPANAEEAADFIRRGLRQQGVGPGVPGHTHLSNATSAVADAIMLDDWFPGEEEKLEELITQAATDWYVWRSEKTGRFK